MINPVSVKITFRCWLRCATPVLFLISYVAGAQQTENVSPAGTKFLLYTPINYAAEGASLPLLVVLHGGEEIGDDLTELTSQTPHQIPSRLIYNNQWPADLPFIVLTPQLKKDLAVPKPNDQEWPESYVDEVIEYVRTAYNVDDNRIYLSGISLGAAGAWTYAAAHPEKVAALLPISGKTDFTQACALKDIPVWAFHGENDEIVVPQFTRDMITAIQACQPPGAFQPHMNILNARPHEGWSEVYNRTNYYDVYSWLLKFSKGNTANTPPFVQAGSDKKIVVRNTPFHLPGEYFDSDGTISDVQWSQLSGPSLTLENTNGSVLKLTGLTAGVFEFRLRVIDNDGAHSADTVRLEILDGIPASSLAVTSLVLTNGNEADIEPLTEGHIINTLELGTSEINIRAAFNVNRSNIKSVRYSINSDQNTRTPNQNRETPDASEYFLRLPRQQWDVRPGIYTICATPFSDVNGGGVQGISQCYTVTVKNEANTVNYFYARQGSDISQLSSWGSNIDGSGAAPESFSADNQIFRVLNNVRVDNPLSISGNGSGLWFMDQANVTINDPISNPIATQGYVMLNVNITDVLTFSELSAGTSAFYNTGNASLPGGIFRNVKIGGAGTTKTLSTGFSARGNLIIEDDVILKGNNRTITVDGIVDIQEKGEFIPETGVALRLRGFENQKINIHGTRASFDQILIDNKNVEVNITGPASGTEIELGSSSGGGLIVNDLVTLRFSNAALKIVNEGSINSGGQKGKIALNNGTLTFQSTSANSSNLYPAEGFDSLKYLSVDLGPGSLLLHDTLFLTDSLKLFNGIVQSNGYLTLVSTPEKTARIARVEGTGQILGDVQFQRTITPGRMYKYLSFPVHGVSVGDLQKYIPVTGKFKGTSKGPGITSNPSLFYYDDPEDLSTDIDDGWKAFPSADTSETFSLGTGYATFIREDKNVVKYNLKGAVHTGDFQFTLDGNHSGDVNRGWNLIGNPYASPVKWGTNGGWSASGVGSAAYVRDNGYGNGRFLVWDGAVGDEEFGGVIAQGQSIWIRTTDDSPSLTIHEQAKVNISDAILYRTRDQGQHLHKMIVTVSHNGLIDRTYIRFKKSGVDAFERHDDAVKQKNAYFNLSSLSSDSVSLAINNISDNLCMKEIGLLISEAKNGTYTLKFNGSVFDQAGGSIYLVDSFLDSAMALREGDDYQFTVTSEAQSSGTRFSLKFMNGLEEPVVTLQDNVFFSSYEKGNQWFLNGKEITGANGPTFQPSATGEYQVRVTNGACTSISTAVTYTVTSTFDPAAAEFEVYPNPATDYVYVRGKSSSPTALSQYNIVSTTGQIVQEGALEIEDNTGVWRFPTYLPSGVYILQLMDNKRQHKVKLFIE